MTFNDFNDLIINHGFKAGLQAFKAEGWKIIKSCSGSYFAEAPEDINIETSLYGQNTSFNGVFATSLRDLTFNIRDTYKGVNP